MAVAILGWLLLVITDDNVRINFYGRVVDTNGRGIPNAKITVMIERAKRVYVPIPWVAETTSRQMMATRTNNDGLFVIRSSGLSLYIHEIDAYGYIDRSQNFSNKSFDYAHRPPTLLDIHAPKADQPVRYTLEDYHLERE